MEYFEKAEDAIVILHKIQRLYREYQFNQNEKDFEYHKDTGRMLDEVETLVEEALKVLK